MTLSLKEKTSYFLITYLFFIIGVGYMIVNYTAKEGTILVNRTWTEFQDVFFTYVTHLGDGVTAVIVILLIFTFSTIRNGIIALSSFVFTAAITQVLKHTFFADAMRPFIQLWHEFKYGDLHMVLPEELMKKGNSFPSGHTTSAFSLFLILTIFFKRPTLGILFAIIAMLTSYSRVYLGQHFFEDIFLGSLIGTFGTLFIYSVFEKKNYFSDLNYSLLNKINDKKNI